MSHTITNLFIFNSSTIIHKFNLQQSLFKDLFQTLYLNNPNLNFRVLKGSCILPMEVGEVMASCEARLLKQKIISGPFTAKEIAEGALWDHLTQEDYDTPLKVNIMSFKNIMYPCESLATHQQTILKCPTPHLLLATR